MNTKSKVRLYISIIFCLLITIIPISANDNSKSLNNIGGYEVRRLDTTGKLIPVESFSDFNKAKERMNALNSTSPHVVTTEVKTVDGPIFGDFGNKNKVSLGDISRARMFFLTKDRTIISDEQFKNAGFTRNGGGQYDVTLGNISLMRRNFLMGSTYTKIIAQPDGGFAQSYPYRKGTVNSVGAKVTLDIYSNANLTTAIGYIPAHYQMEVFDIIKQGDSFVAEINISGLRGYVDINKIDLIPYASLTGIKGEGGIPLTLGGYEQYYKVPEDPYTIKITPEYYEVKKNGAYNEIIFNQSRTGLASNGKILTGFSAPFGIAPDWMAPGIYYSRDDIHYFTDLRKQKPVKDGSQIGEYYSYFQWLPLNTKSNHSAETLKRRLSAVGKSNSIYFNETSSFIDNGTKYGINPLLTFAQANLESSYGTSALALSKFNLFGQNAVDSNPDQAYDFKDVNHAIRDQTSYYLRQYMVPGTFRHNGFSFGNKSSGVTYKYASDPLYGMKIASVAYLTDRDNNFLDYNNYQLVKLKDHQPTSFSTGSNGSGVLYKSKSAINIIVTNLGQSNGYYKTNRVSSPNSSDYRAPLNLDSNFVYYPVSGSKILQSYGPKRSLIGTNLSISVPHEGFENEIIENNETIVNQDIPTLDDERDNLNVSNELDNSLEEGNNEKNN